MTLIARSLQRKPLGLSVFAFLTSLPCLAFMIQEDRLFHWEQTVAGALCLSSCLIALVNLIRAAADGYSSTRTGLSITAIFFGIIPGILIGFQVLWRLR